MQLLLWFHTIKETTLIMSLASSAVSISYPMGRNITEPSLTNIDDEAPATAVVATKPRSARAEAAIQSFHNRSPNLDETSDNQNAIEIKKKKKMEQDKQKPIVETDDDEVNPATFSNMEGFQPTFSNNSFLSSSSSSSTTPFFSSSTNTNLPQRKTENQEIIDKLNFVINLLEDQQDTRTGHVTEDIVLYCFLGIFIIFIVDTFSKGAIGKYTR